MKRTWLVGLAGVSVLLGGSLLVLSGCGGGGGPINNPGGGGGGGGFSAQFLQLIKDNAPDQVAATAIGSQACLGCHVNAPQSGWHNTVHFTKNVGCENCHGFGSVHAANRAANVAKATDMLTMPAIDNIEVCGQCHGPIHDQLAGSKHGEVVDEVVNPASGTRSLDCIRCHESALRNTFINIPWTKGLMASPPLTPTQLQTNADVAIKALGQPDVATLATFSHQTTTCVTCHEPHSPTGQTLASGEDIQLRRISQSQDTSNVVPPNNASTATPPGGAVTSNWNHICATCHNGRTADPSDTNLLKSTSTSRSNFHENPAFNMLSGVTGSLPPGTSIQNGSHRTVEDQCVHCHMPNNATTGQASHTFTVNYDVSCLPCHTAADAAARAASVKSETLSNMLVLRTALEAWAQSKFGDSRFWDYTAFVDPSITAAVTAIQSQVPIEIRRARHNYYFVTFDRSQGIHNAPYTRQLLNYSIGQVNGLLGRSAKVTPSALSTKSVKDIQRMLAQDRLRATRGELQGMHERL